MAEELTDNEILAYLGIDYADDMVMLRINGAKAAAADYLKGAIGEKVDLTSPRAKELMIVCIGDMYDTRRLNEQSGRIKASTRKLIDDFILQLVLEGRDE